MIDFNTIKVGDKCRIVGMGAPGFAMLGDTVTVTSVGRQRVDVEREDGKSAYFALTCGASRLELIEAGEQPTTAAGTPCPCNGCVTENCDQRGEAVECSGRTV